MQEKKFVKTLRVAKVVQLGLLLIVEIAFFLILLCSPSLSRQLYSTGPLLALCAVVWILMLFHFGCLIYDFTRLRTFAKESHNLNQIAYLDAMTGIPNRHGLDYLYKAYVSLDAIQEIGCCLLTIENLDEVNKTLGRPVGDNLILDFCSLLEQTGDSIGTVGRNGGNEFLFIMDSCTQLSMEHFLELLQEKLNAYNQIHPQVPLQIRHSYVLNSEAHIETFSQLLIATYNQLHA